MKSRVYIFLALTAALFYGQSIAQEFAVSDSITTYHQLSDNKEFVSATKLAFKIGDYYIQNSEFSIAKKFYNFASINASRGAKVVLEARATFKQGMTEKRMAESGSYSMDEEQNYFKDCIKSLKRAHTLFIKAKMSGSYEDVMTLTHGGEAQFIIGDYKGSVKALKIALRDAQKNRYNDLALKSSDLLAQNYNELNDESSRAYYYSIYKNYQDFFISKDSLAQSVEEIEKLETTTQTQKTELELRKTEIITQGLLLENQNAVVEKNMAVIKQNKLERRLMIGSIGVILIFLIVSVILYQYKRKTNRKLAEQYKQILKQKSLIEKKTEGTERRESQNRCFVVKYFTCACGG